MAILLLLGVSALTYRSISRLLDLDEAANEVQRTQFDLQRLLTVLVDAEVGRRSFHATGSSSFLEPYKRARPLARELLEGLQRRIQDPEQRRRLAWLDRLAKDVIDGELAAPGPGTDAGGLVERMQLNKSRLDAVRALVGRMLEAQRRLHGERQRSTVREAGLAASALAGGGAVAVGALALSFLMMNAESRRRLSADEKLRQTNAELDARVRERTAELAASARAAQLSNDSLNALVESSPLGILALDLDGVVTLWNAGAERILGWPRDEVLGGLYPAVAEEQRENFRELLGHVQRGGQLREVEVERARRDGRPVRLRVSAAPLHGDDGAVRGSVYFIEDVTEQHKLELQLAQAQKMEAIGRLTGGLAHDFNNILTVVIGNLDLLDAKLGRTDQAPLLREALEACLHGSELTRRLVAFSRQQPLAAEAFDPNALTQRMTSLLRRTLGEPVELEMQLAPDLWRAEADPTQVESAIANLAINARDAMPRGGRLVIETANRTLDAAYAAENAEVRPGDYVMIALTDTGEGIPQDVLARVFEPFFTTKEAGKGSGLGLPMVYGFARQSGGHVKLYSEVGHGTTVRLYLPRAKADATAAADGPSPALERRAQPGETILVVEDNERVRKVALVHLGELGYRTAEAANAAEALIALAGDERIDLVFTDIVMPGAMNGQELAQEVQRLRPGVPVLLTSGFAESVIARPGDGNGRDRPHLLVKPYRRRELAEKVRAVLDDASPA